MTKEITITNANNLHSFISFRINGLEDGITVGIISDPNSHGQALSIAYKGETKIVPLNAMTEDLEELNSDENVIKPSRLKESDKITTTLTIDKETYDWLTTTGEDDDVGYWQPDQVTESSVDFEKELYNKEIDTKKVESCKKIFEGIDKVDVEVDNELTNTKQALDVAVDALIYANKCIKGGCVDWVTHIDRALAKITEIIEIRK